jgi:UDPglucose 6-dehydrogenase
MIEPLFQDLFQDKTVSVVGLGKLGLPLAACIAAKGFQVVGVDCDARKVADLNLGRASTFEPHLEETIRCSAERIRAVQDIESAVAASEITFVVVATPSEDDGSFSLRYVLSACEDIGRTLRTKHSHHLVVLTSTVMPGSTGGIVRETLEKTSGKQVGRDFGLCYSPEFIALGSVIHDLLHPDFLLIGESDRHSGAVLEALYRNICENEPSVAHMNFVNAEIAKLSVNTFVTTKISFANMLARICERLPEADVDVVTGALALDTRIGGKYLKGAVGYGGPCFPRDNRALAALARQIGSPADIAQVTDTFNRAQVTWLADLVERMTEPGSTVGILGLTYKPNTDVVEQAIGLLLAEELAARHVGVVSYDPSGSRSLFACVQGAVRFAESAVECISESDTVVLATPWEAFAQIPAERWARIHEPRMVIDCWRILGFLRDRPGICYVALGRGKLPLVHRRSSVHQNVP